MHPERHERRNYRATVIGAIGMVMLIGLPVWAFRGPGHGKLSGRVTFAGKPVAAGIVVAVAADGSAKSSVTDADGWYSLDGVTNGKVQFGVISRDPAKAAQAVADGRPQRPRPARGPRHGGRQSALVRDSAPVREP